MAKPYSPADKIKDYNKIVEDRGYDFFSPQAQAAHKEKFGNKKPGDIRKDAREKCDAFMAACNDINHRDHAASHNTLTTKFGNSEEEALNSFVKEEAEKNGQLFEQIPVRNTNYEKKLLDQQKPKKTSDFVEAKNWATLGAILKAKWKAVGYADDDGVINEYNRDYAHNGR